MISTKPRIFVIIGTRPEAIKMGPVVQALTSSQSLCCEVVSTAQHKEMLRPMYEFFGIHPRHDLDLMQPNQSLGGFTSRALAQLTDLFSRERPQFILVQGDTSTAMAAGMAGFYCGIPSGHVEAGLRSGNMAHPFPEELNRRVVALVATFHFAPTENARRNLLREALPSQSILVTGNTVVDAVHYLKRALPQSALPKGVDPARPIILVTAHRRENHGGPLEGICHALRRLAEVYPDVQIVYPVHLNPHVRGPVHRLLDNVPQVRLMPPLDYPALLSLMDHATLILTDSGGIQEEAASLCKPVLILREVTERPEVVEAGFGEIVGTEPDRIVDRARVWMDSPQRRDALCRLTSPFGDGRASERIVKAIEQHFGATAAGAVKVDAASRRV